VVVVACALDAPMARPPMSVAAGAAAGGGLAGHGCYLGAAAVGRGSLF